MDYVYEVNVTDNHRHIKAIYVDGQTGTGNDFAPADFTQEDFLADPYDMLVATHLECLVHLFTGKDPIKELHKISPDCQHEYRHECDCTPVTIPIPTVLAFHTHTLMVELAELKSDFNEWTKPDGTTKVYNYRTPDGEPRTLQGKYQTGYYNDERSKALFYELTARRKVLDKWYEQGIALYHAWNR